MRAKLLLCMAFAAAIVGGSPALANGGDFFEELNASWGQQNSDDGVPYFGFVRDSKGKTIPNASIKATTAKGSSFVVQADNMGHYRIPGFSKSVDAKQVQITCSKAGYQLGAGALRVMRTRVNVHIETNCVLAPAATKPIS